MKGQIVKILSDIHFVSTENETIPCTCRGIFRKNKVNPYVGDFVLFDEEKKQITEVLKRKNEIKRPPVANIDQGFIITSLKTPDFDPFLLDKLIVQLELNHITPVIILTKLDLVSEEVKEKVRETMKYYKEIGYTVLENTQLEEIKKLFQDKTTVFTGQTGAGKSRLLNQLDENLNLETGEVSESLGRGRHTTRHIELWNLFGGKVLDTPGFSALEFTEYEPLEIASAMIEFKNYPCPFRDCSHTNEPECQIKKEVEKGTILKSRYDSYRRLVMSPDKRRRKW